MISAAELAAKLTAAVSTSSAAVVPARPPAPCSPLPPPPPPSPPRQSVPCSPPLTSLLTLLPSLPATSLHLVLVASASAESCRLSQSLSSGVGPPEAATDRLRIRTACSGLEAGWTEL